MTAYYFVQPMDVLLLRGNKSFGGAGEHGEAVMPPWPSLFAGAFRSALLADDSNRLAQFVALGTQRTLTRDAQQEKIRGLLGNELFKTLGTPAEPGDFRLTWVSLAARAPGGVLAAVPLPADLAAFDDENADRLATLRPAQLPAGIAISSTLPMSALLRTRKQVKPTSGRWLDMRALATHLNGLPPGPTLGAASFYKRETRLGIALDPNSRTASDGALYTTEAIAMSADAGFLVGIEGEHGQLPSSGLLRLGGDGKGGFYERVTNFAAPEPAMVEPGGRFRLILATPGFFHGGWLPDGVERQEDGSYRLYGDGFSARLACAVVSRYEVVSGWDLAHWCPKTAQRVAPTGSVYWFDEFAGTSDKLAEWVASGLWEQDLNGEQRQRRAEGFNLAWLAAWRNTD